MFVGSQLRTPRHIHTDHGEGTDGVINRGAKTRLVGTTEAFKAKKKTFNGIRKGDWSPGIKRNYHA